MPADGASRSPPLRRCSSFTTVATLGYGDVSPLSPGARALSVMEGLAGQLYLAVLVARLVAIHTARALKP
jgi:voltage-gated potassium channel